MAPVTLSGSLQHPHDSSGLEQSLGTEVKIPPKRLQHSLRLCEEPFLPGNPLPFLRKGHQIQNAHMCQALEK